MASLDDVNQRRSDKNLKVHFELPEYKDSPNYRQQLSTSSSSSDSSLGSDDTENDAQSIDTHKSNHAGSSEFPTPTLLSDYIYPSPQESNNGGSGFPTPTLLSDYICASPQEPNYGGRESPVLNYQGGLATQSPSSQMMGQPGHDPNRIPLSIFSTKPANPAEWSITSNESLFSLHIGNTSFSRDHFFALYKSGELPRLDECISVPMAFPPVEKVVQGQYTADMEKHSVSTDTAEEITNSVMEKHCDKVETSKETAMVVSPKTPKDYRKEVMVSSEESGPSTSISYRSEESMMSSSSFQFPVLTGDGGRHSSAKVESQKQEPGKPLGPSSPKIETAPNPRSVNWRHCFSCCSPCY